MNNQSLKSGDSENGFALILVMVMLVILTLLGTLVLDTSVTDLKITSNYRSASDAFNAASAAVEYGSSPGLMFSTTDSYLARIDAGGNFVTGNTINEDYADGTTASLDVEDRFEILQNSGIDLVKSTDETVNVVNNLGPSDLPSWLSAKFGDEFAGNFYRINIQAQARNQSQARIETQKVRIFKKSDDSVFYTTGSD